MFLTEFSPEAEQTLAHIPKQNIPPVHSTPPTPRAVHASHNSLNSHTLTFFDLNKPLYHYIIIDPVARHVNHFFKGKFDRYCHYQWTCIENDENAPLEFRTLLKDFKKDWFETEQVNQNGFILIRLFHEKILRLWTSAPLLSKKLNFENIPELLFSVGKEVNLLRFAAIAKTNFKLDSQWKSQTFSSQIRFWDKHWKMREPMDIQEAAGRAKKWLEQSFTHLRVNFINGQLPKEIKYLTVKTLDLGNNELTQLDKNLFRINLIKNLILENNCFSEFPPILCHYQKIQHLDLSSNQIKDIPSEIYRMKSLSILILSQNRIEKIPDEICQMRSLTKISLSHNCLKIIPEKIYLLTNLTHLFLNDNHLTQVPRGIVYLERLKKLSLKGNVLEGDSNIKRKRIMRLPTIENIHVSECGGEKKTSKVKNAQYRLNREFSYFFYVETLEVEKRKLKWFLTPLEKLYFTTLQEYGNKDKLKNCIETLSNEEQTHFYKLIENCYREMSDEKNPSLTNQISGKKIYLNVHPVILDTALEKLIIEKFEKLEIKNQEAVIDKVVRLANQPAQDKIKNREFAFNHLGLLLKVLPKK